VTEHLEAEENVVHRTVTVALPVDRAVEVFTAATAG